MTSVFLPAAPGHDAIYLNKRGGGTGFARRAVLAWKVTDAFHVRAFPVTMIDHERTALPDAVIFPDGHVESTDGIRAWRDLISYRAAMDREARERTAGA